MVSLFHEAIVATRRLKAFLSRKDSERKSREFQLVKGIEGKRRDLVMAKEKVRSTADSKAKRKHNKKRREARQEIFRLQRELAILKNGMSVEPTVGTLPDFVIIGTQKGGTNFLYYLLTQHPLVEPAARKEIHFFDSHFDRNIGWYCSCFPRPSWKNGRRVITGEATPSYLFYPPVAERMAEVLPHARLIVLLRNPVDRAFSHYQMQVRWGLEPRAFEDAIQAEVAQLHTEEGNSPTSLCHADLEQRRSSYLSRGIYVDQLLRWYQHFNKEQILIVRSEIFFQRTTDTLKSVENFLDLPEWEPDAAQLFQRRHTGGYQQEMSPSTRQRLETFFKPHNRKLYDYLGLDYGW